MNLQTLRIPHNYVLILPDERFETYQFNGKETGILSSADPSTDGQHLGVKGKVLRLPERLIYHGDEIFRLQRLGGADLGRQTEIQRLRGESMMYDVPMELEVGDIALFNYQQYYDAGKNGRYIPTPEGEAILVRYDELLAAHKFDDPDSFWMLNGLVLVEPLEIPHIQEDGILYLDDDSPLKKPLLEATPFLRKHKKYQFGVIDRVGCLVRGYRDFSGMGDDTRKLSPGTVVAFHPSYAVNLEYDLHRTLSEKKLYRFHRKDILLVFPDFEIKSIISNFVH